MPGFEKKPGTGNKFLICWILSIEKLCVKGFV